MKGIIYMDKIIEFLASALNNENYINIASILVVAFTSYQVAKYNASKPNKLRVKQLQLEHVYLPLYRILVNLPKDLNKRTAIEIHKKIDNILNSHYELAFPQLHQLNAQLKESLLNNGDYHKVLHIIFHQVSVDYELLKKSLGYPSENSFNLFIRMTKKQKYSFIISWINILWIFIPIFYVYPVCLKFPTYGIFISLALYFLLAIFMLKINNHIKRLPD